MQHLHETGARDGSEFQHCMMESDGEHPLLEAADLIAYVSMPLQFALS